MGFEWVEIASLTSLWVRTGGPCLAISAIRVSVMSLSKTYAVGVGVNSARYTALGLGLTVSLSKTLTSRRTLSPRQKRVVSVPRPLKIPAISTAM